MYAARFGSAAAFRRGWSVDHSATTTIPFPTREAAEKELAHLREWAPERYSQARVEYSPPGAWSIWNGWVIAQPGLCACVGETPKEALRELAAYAEEHPDVDGRTKTGRARPIWVFPCEVVAWEPGCHAVAYVRPTGKPRRVSRRKFILKWLSPVLVGGGEEKELPVTIRPVE